MTGVFICPSHVLRKLKRLVMLSISDFNGDSSYVLLKACLPILCGVEALPIHLDRSLISPIHLDRSLISPHSFRWEPDLFPIHLDGSLILFALNSCPEALPKWLPRSEICIIRTLISFSALQKHFSPIFWVGYLTPGLTIPSNHHHRSLSPIWNGKRLSCRGGAPSLPSCHANNDATA